MRYRIIGYAESDFKQAEDDMNLEEIVYHTTKKALGHAGLSIEQIDTVVQAGDDVQDGININHVYIVEPAGSYLKEESKIEQDGAYALFYALCRLGTPKYNTAMIVSYSKSSETSVVNMGAKPYSNPEVSGSWYYHTQLDPFLMRPLGHDVTTWHAMQYQAFLQESGLSEEDIAACVSKNLTQGMENPNAPFARKISAGDVMKSGYVSTPIKKAELPPMTDGCSILIVAKEDWADKNGKSGPTITGVGSACDTYYPGYRKLERAETASVAADKALKMAGRERKDIQLAEIYDLFSYQEPLLYRELFGWSAGEIREKLKSNATAKGGALPVNVSGGVLCAHPIMAAGTSRIIHLADQLKAGKAKTGLAHSQSGLGLQNNIVYIIES